MRSRQIWVLVIVVLGLAALGFRRASNHRRIIKRREEVEVIATVPPVPNEAIQLFEKTLEETQEHVKKLGLTPQKPLVTIISSPQPFLNAHT
jgi:hypothetical protein